MLRIGIVAAHAIVAVFLIMSGMAVGGAMAQTAANGAPGQPIQLLPIAQQGKAAAKPAAKPVDKSSVKSRVALRRKTKAHVSVAAARARHHAAPQVADADPASRSAAPTAPAAAAPADDPAIAAAASRPEAGPPEPIPAGAPIAANHATQVIAPRAGKESDLVAPDAGVALNAAASPTAVAAAAPSMREVADVTPKSDSADVAGAPRQSEVGSVSWILQVLAALGGAVTAGAVAWFLIGRSPQQTYG
jgi:hypothetical protein